MQCNIDARGKAVRLIMGLTLVLIGALMLITWRAIGVAFWLELALIGGGLLAIIEGWAGWCVVRAMGFKTRV